MLKIRPKTINTSKYNYNSQEFYKRHPDLALRNVYLASGRVINKEDVDKYIEKFTRLSFGEKCEQWFGKIKQLFKKKS